jgi:phosphonate transport system ATP-binding protein
MEILATINRIDGCTVLVSLHQVNVAMKYCPRTIALHKGRVVYDGPSSALTPALLRELYGSEADDILMLPDHISALVDVADRGQNLQNRPLPSAVAASI